MNEATMTAVYIIQTLFGSDVTQFLSVRTDRDKVRYTLEEKKKIYIYIYIIRDQGKFNFNALHSGR